MTKVNLFNNQYFSDNKKLALLNEIIAIHTTLSPGLLMSYTGCSIKDAFYVLVLLFEKYLADGYYMIYYKINPDEAIQRRRIEIGLPKVPIQFSYNDEELIIENMLDIFYTFEFDLLETDVEFVMDTDDRT